MSLLQSLYFKFTGAPEAMHIFAALGGGRYGRIGLGIVELITAILILIPKTVYFGAWIGVLLMIGAVISHVALVGLEVQGDGGKLFILAQFTLARCTFFVLFHNELNH